MCRGIADIAQLLLAVISSEPTITCLVFLLEGGSERSVIDGAHGVECRWSRSASKLAVDGVVPSPVFPRKRWPCRQKRLPDILCRNLDALRDVIPRRSNSSPSYGRRDRVRCLGWWCTGAIIRPPLAVIIDPASSLVLKEQQGTEGERAVVKS